MLMRPDHTALLAAFAFVSACSPNTKINSGNLRELALKHSHEISSKRIALNEYADHSKLRRVDTFTAAVFSQHLKQTEGWSSEDECNNNLRYFGHFTLDTQYIAALFVYRICSDGNEDKLLMAILNQHGTITDSMVVANVNTYAECNYEHHASFTGKQFLIAGREECYIIDEKDADHGKLSVDSFTCHYEVSNKGKILFKNKIHTAFVR